MNRILRIVILTVTLPLAASAGVCGEESPFPGERGVDLDLACRTDIWEKEGGGFLAKFVKVPRDQVVGFALYTHDHGVLKMSAQLYPLQEGEAREVRLELKTDGQWREVAKAPVSIPVGRPTSAWSPGTTRGTSPIAFATATRPCSRG
jgi:hypothetical protein